MADRIRPEDGALHITVSDPVQHQEGMNKYTSYRVDVRGEPNANYSSSSTANNNLFQSSGYSAVLRRYSDFLWLFERLHKERAGAIVPPLPEKQAVARFTAAFVEDRRMNLERFLRRVSVHPELSDAPSLQVFLRADDAAFHTAKTSQGAGLGYSPTTAPIRKPEGLKQWFAETKTSIATSVMGSTDLVRSPDDDLFEEIDRYISDLDAQMKAVSQQASSLVRKGKEIANGMFEFGLAFNLLGQSEADSLGVSLTKIGDAADALSALSADHAEKEVSNFEEPIRDYIKTISAVKLALSKRHDRRLTYTTALQKVQNKQNDLMNLRGVFGKEDKAYQAELSLQRAQEACEAAREDFATVSQRVLREVDRFKREKADDMRRTVMDYIHLQIEYNKRMEEVWAKLIPQLEQASEGEGDAGVVNDQYQSSVAAGVSGNASNANY